MTEANYIIKTFGDLQAGDLILDENGNAVEVKTAYDAHVPDLMYELELEDGSIIKASGNHLWYIETVEDKLSHSTRVKNAKFFLKEAPVELFSGLEDIASFPEAYEVTFLDILDLFDYLPNYFDFKDEYSKAFFFVKRILLSVGHITEHSQQMVDFATGELGEEEYEDLYDGRVIAQQILALSGIKKYKKRWRPIVGRVVTTDDIFLKYQDADIPTVKKRK